MDPTEIVQSSCTRRGPGLGEVSHDESRTPRLGPTRILLMPGTTIAVIGTGNSGKTVFLTSLLWQLREWRGAEDFHLGNGVSISRFAPSNGRPVPDDVFPFDHYRDALVARREWPAKTKDVHRFSCQYTIGDRRWWRRQQRQRLHLIDLPGERVADAAIAEFGDFADWSDHMFKCFADDSEYQAARRFRASVESGAMGTEAILRQYRRVLAELVRDSKPLVTPSVFVLDREGSLAPSIGHGEEERLVESRLTGLDPTTQFAPLPPNFRQNHPDTAKTMRSRYDRYRRELARPYFEHLASSESLIVLIDIPLLLRGDVGRFNDTRQIVKDLIGAMNQESTIGRRLARALKRRSLSSLRRVAFVANKADLVSHEDRGSGRLKSLLRQMNKHASELLPTSVKSEWFVCSACVSTRRGKEEHTLIGAPFPGNPAREEHLFPVSPLPDHWPPAWSTGAFSFPDVYPQVRPNLLYPPRQHQLDAVFRFVAMA